MKTININTSSKKYNIYIEDGILSKSGSIIKNLGFNDKIMIVTDDNVAPLYLDTVKKSLSDEGFSVDFVILQNGEEHKNIESVLKIYEALSKGRFNRKDMILALGGGVVGDMSGFAASTYLRGIKYIQIPTTLLSQVDSSVGGKTGIDLPFGKNLVGAFLQPECVIADSNTLKTLSDEQISCGMAEVIKSALIRSEDFVNFLLDSDDFFRDAEEIIIRSVNIKKEIVEIDEFEKYDRMLLNFGHTLGHSIEKYYNYRGITHGQAIAYGMNMITKNKEVREILLTLLRKYGLKSECDIPVKELIDIAKNDKKAINDIINIVVVKKAGKGEIKNISFEEFYKQYE